MAPSIWPSSFCRCVSQSANVPLVCVPSVIPPLFSTDRCAPRGTPRFFSARLAPPPTFLKSNTAHKGVGVLGHLDRARVIWPPCGPRRVGLHNALGLRAEEKGEPPLLRGAWRFPNNNAPFRSRFLGDAVPLFSPAQRMDRVKPGIVDRARTFWRTGTDVPTTPCLPTNDANAPECTSHCDAPSREVACVAGCVDIWVRMSANARVLTGVRTRFLSCE